MVLWEPCRGWAPLVAGAPNPAKTELLVLLHPEALSLSDLLALWPWSDEDKARMRAFRSDKALTSWCLSRVLFRRFWQARTGCPWSDDLLIFGPQGKPAVLGGPAFNWAHTQGCVALAWSQGDSIGCDVEDSFRPLEDFEGISDSYFRPEEALWVRGTENQGQRWRRFLSLFVQKEAQLKASGRGLSEELNSVSAVLNSEGFETATLLFDHAAGHQRYPLALCGHSLEGLVARFWQADGRAL